MDINEIQALIPHRYPFLLIDRVVEIRGDSYLKAIKNVTVNEPFFQGHYPGNPIMPGVLIIEAMAQAAVILGLKSLGDLGERKIVPLFAGIEKARFKKPVRPGDVLIIEVEILKKRGVLWWTSCVARVDGKAVCRAELQAAFPESI